MKTIPCEVIRDLLPSHIDGLTSDVTDRVIKDHLEGCAACREVLSRMRGQEAAPPADERGKKEIDFLKKNRKRNRRIVLASVAGAFVLALLVLCVRMFVVGSRNTAQWAAMNLAVEGRQLTFTAVPLDSASAIARLTYTEEDGVVTVNARSVLVSFLHRGSKPGNYTAAEPIREVRLGNRTVWADGQAISAYTSEVFATRHDYIGDAPANSRTAMALGLADRLGAFTSRLETAKEPYGWTVLLEEEVPAERLAEREADMEAYARVMIGLIGNLDHVTFSCRADGKEYEHTVTAAEASEFFGEDIKTIGKSVTALGRLLELSGLRR